MSDFCARNLISVPKAYADEVKLAALEASKANLLICVVVDEYDNVETFQNSPEWVENYYRTGGMWDYYDPQNFLLIENSQ